MKGGKIDLPPEKTTLKKPSLIRVNKVRHLILSKISHIFHKNETILDI